MATAASMVSHSWPPFVPSVKPFVQQAYPIQPAVTAPIPGESPRPPSPGGVSGLHIRWPDLFSGGVVLVLATAVGFLSP